MSQEIHLDRFIPDNLYTPYDREVECKLLALVGENENGIKIGNAVRRLGERYDSFVVKEITWRLLYSGALTLSSDRRLESTGKSSQK